MYTAYHSVLPNSLQNVFKLCVSTRGTRQRDTFRSHRVRTNIKSVCTSVCGVKLWHSLHENITSCRSLQAFKNLQVTSSFYGLGLKNKNNYNQTLYVRLVVFVSYITILVGGEP